jgi:thioredoxin reductase (NADPH)
MARRYDIVVAGGGLAGLSAALTAARRGRKVMVATGGVPGGLLLNIERIEGLPGFPAGVAGYELCPAVQEQAEAAGAELSLAEIKGLAPAEGGWSLRTSEDEIDAGAVVVATGARFRALGVPGEKRLAGHGVSTCASCDGPLLRGRTAAIVGGGDSALQEALTLADADARVIILYRGERLRGQATYIQRVMAHARIEVQFATIVEEIIGAETVEAVRVRDLAQGKERELEVAAVFPFVGLEPNASFLEGMAELDGDGCVCVDGAHRTSCAGLFAAGIVRSRATARAAAVAGDGAAAALSADRYLDGSV